MQKLLIILAYTITLFSQAHTAEKHKLSNDTVGPSSTDLVGNYYDRFILSLEPSSPNFPMQYWTGRYALPHVGVYANQSSKYSLAGITFKYYQWSPQIVLIQLPQSQLWDLLPPSIQKVLLTKKIDRNYFKTKGKTRGYFSLSGNPYYQLGESTTLVSPKGYNLSFHSSIFPLESQGENAYPLVGIFDPKGLKSNDIPINILESRNVFLHADKSRASSPDNLKFNFTEDRATFWSISLYKGEVIATYHVVLKNDLHEEIIRSISRDSDTLSELADALKDAGLENQVIFFLNKLL
jgi:hypothetical protein